MKFSTTHFIQFLLLLVLLSVNINLHAQPAPLPADDEFLQLVEQIEEADLRSDIDDLVGFFTRHTWSDTVSDAVGIGAARRWVFNQYEDHGLTPSYHEWQGFWNGQPTPSYNVMGSYGNDPSPRIVLGGHLDSRNADRNDNEGFAPGADDDASGVTALLNMAQLLGDFEGLNAHINLVAFTGEEQGLLGSNALSQDLRDQGAVLRGMLNMDMLAHIEHPNGDIDSTTIRLFSANPMNSPSRALAHYCKWVGESYSDGLTVTLQNAEDRPGRGGDHSPFSDRGFPAVRFIESGEDVAYQHDTTDTPQHMNFSYFRKATRLVFGSMLVLGSAPEACRQPQLFNSGDGTSFYVHFPEEYEGPFYVAVRHPDELYWHDVHFSDGADGILLDGYNENDIVLVSLSHVLNGENNRPAVFTEEVSIQLTSELLPPRDVFTLSNEDNVMVFWRTTGALNVNGVIIERAANDGQFEEITRITIDPQGPRIQTFFDDTTQSGPMYRYRLFSRSDTGELSEPSEEIRGAVASHHLGPLVINEINDHLNNPTSEEVLTHYLENILPLPLNGGEITIYEGPRPVTDADFARYSPVLVIGDHLNASFAEDSIAFNWYLRSGGKLVICGWRLSNSLMDQNQYENQFSETDFISQRFGIEEIHVTPPLESQFIATHSEADFPELQFDSERINRYGEALPLMDAIWHEFDSEEVTVLGRFDAIDDDSPFEVKPVAIMDASDDPMWAFVDVPLYAMTVESASNFLEELLVNRIGWMTSVDERQTVESPRKFSLATPSPNPFNSTVTIPFNVPEIDEVEIAIYNLLGRKIATLLNQRMSPGSHQVVWNSEVGLNAVSSGVFFVKMEADGFVQSRKIVLMK
ncbi:M20/M25/M40 family metallo-hydrolase [bacterium]|nr:M20/M25/M40 family metallo-hydrolase [bacterium]